MQKQHEVQSDCRSIKNDEKNYNLDHQISKRKIGYVVTKVTFMVGEERRFFCEANIFGFGEYVGNVCSIREIGGGAELIVNNMVEINGLSFDDVLEKLQTWCIMFAEEFSPIEK